MEMNKKYIGITSISDYSAGAVIKPNDYDDVKMAAVPTISAKLDQESVDAYGDERVAETSTIELENVYETVSGDCDDPAWKTKADKSLPRLPADRPVQVVRGLTISKASSHL